MTPRERWIVYPLLFLTLGIAMRDKVAPPERFVAQTVHCAELRVGSLKCDRLEAISATSRSLGVVNSQGKAQVSLGVTPGGAGQIELRGKSGRKIALIGADRTAESGIIATLRAVGGEERPLVVLLPHEDSGAVVTFDQNMRELFMGHAGPNLGVFGWMPGQPRPIFLTRPWQTRFPPPPPAQTPDDSE